MNNQCPRTSGDIQAAVILETLASPASPIIKTAKV
jgi:hypothetical protein